LNGSGTNIVDINFFISCNITIFVLMTTLTINIDNKKTEKAIRAVLDAFDLDYNVENSSSSKRHLNKSEQVIYTRLEKTAREIELYKKGEIELQSAKDFLDEL
jgi:hypothetical protein